MIEAIQWTGRVIAAANLAYAAWTIYSAWRQHRLDLDYLWILGLAIFGLVIQWASGLTLWLAWASWLACVIILGISLIWQSMARKRRQAKINAEILRRIEDNKDGTWELSPSLILTIETKTIEEASPVEEDTTDDQCI